jgi:hypothetical protein
MDTLHPWIPLHLWWALKLTFIGLCLLGTTLTLLWIASVVVGAWVMARQRRALPRRYRVGEVVSDRSGKRL